MDERQKLRSVPLSAGGARPPAVQHGAAAAAGPPSLRGGPVPQAPPRVITARAARAAHTRLHQEPQHHPVVGDAAGGRAGNAGGVRCSDGGRQTEAHLSRTASSASGGFLCVGFFRNWCLVVPELSSFDPEYGTGTVGVYK
jgi:hypothetical protein